MKRRQRKQEKSLENNFHWPSIFNTNFQSSSRPTKEDGESFWAIDACIDRISGDFAKMGIEVQEKSSKIWQEIHNDISSLLKRPNSYQNNIQFREYWMMSKLKYGNVYVLKERDNHNNITSLYILNPEKVKVKITDNGQIYYEIGEDKLNGINETLLIPQSEIIHDRYRPRFNPLIGTSPVASAYLSGALGKKILEESYEFFKNGANTSGILVAPGRISRQDSEEIEKKWREKFSRNNFAVIGSGMKFEPLRSTSIDAQVVEQLNLSSEIVASCFNVPAFKIGIGKYPENPQMANQMYYSDCIQILVEEFEAVMDIGLELKDNQRINLDVSDLNRMDKSTLIKIEADAVRSGIRQINEARNELNWGDVEGGDSIYMQQQYYSLQALAERDKETSRQINESKQEIDTEEFERKLKERLEEGEEEWKN